MFRFCSVHRGSENSKTYQMKLYEIKVSWSFNSFSKVFQVIFVCVSFKISSPDVFLLMLHKGINMSIAKRTVQGWQSKYREHCYMLLSLQFDSSTYTAEPQLTSFLSLWRTKRERFVLELVLILERFRWFPWNTERRRWWHLKESPACRSFTPP